MEDLENQMDLYQRNNLNEFVKKDFILKFKAERIEQMEKENERIKSKNLQKERQNLYSRRKSGKEKFIYFANSI